MIKLDISAFSALESLQPKSTVFTNINLIGLKSRLFFYSWRRFKIFKLMILVMELRSQKLNKDIY